MYPILIFATGLVLATGFALTVPAMSTQTATAAIDARSTTRLDDRIPLTSSRVLEAGPSKTEVRFRFQDHPIQVAIKVSRKGKIRSATIPVWAAFSSQLLVRRRSDTGRARSPSDTS